MVASRDKKLIAKKADELGHLLSEAIGKLLEANKAQMAHQVLERRYLPSLTETL